MTAAAKASKARGPIGSHACPEKASRPLTLPSRLAKPHTTNTTILILSRSHTRTHACTCNSEQRTALHCYCYYSLSRSTDRSIGTPSQKAGQGQHPPLKSESRRPATHHAVSLPPRGRGPATSLTRIDEALTARSE